MVSENAQSRSVDENQRQAPAEELFERMKEMEAQYRALIRGKNTLPMDSEQNPPGRRGRENSPGRLGHLADQNGSRRKDNSKRPRINKGSGEDQHTQIDRSACNQIGQGSKYPHPGRKVKPIILEQVESKLQTENSRSLSRSARQNTSHQSRRETEIEYLKKRLEELENEKTGDNIPSKIDRKTPFAPHIAGEPAPPKLKVPQIGLYSGSTDPLNHLHRYLSWMELQNASEALLCKVFPLTLGEKAQRWFRNLPPHSIRSWDQLADQFSKYFTHSKAKVVPKERLLTVKQEDGESLRKYLDKFNKLVMEIEHVSDDALLIAVMTGLKRDTHFWWSIHETSPSTYHEFLSRAERAMIAEEAVSSPSNKDKGKNIQKSSQNNRRGGSTARQTSSFKTFENPMEKEVRAMLNTSPATIFQAIQHTDMLPEPQPIHADVSKLNPRKYCKYHRSIGHDTDQCRQLLTELLKLIEAGHLRRFTSTRGGDDLGREQATRQPAPPRPQAPRNNPKEVNTLTPGNGGHAGISNR